MTGKGLLVLALFLAVGGCGAAETESASTQAPGLQRAILDVEGAKADAAAPPPAPASPVRAMGEGKTAPAT